MVAGCEIRRRWRGITVLMLLVGVVGAAVLATVAGARRPESALGRFNAYSRSGDLELTVGNATPPQLRTFAGVPGVRAFAPLRAGAMVVPRAPQLQAIASAVDTRFGTVVDRARVVAGRAAAPSAADEITIGETLAATLHIGIGGHLDAQSYTPQQVATFEMGMDGGPPAGPRPRLRVVGIVRRPLDLGDRGAAGGVLVLTPAFTRRYASKTIATVGLVVGVPAGLVVGNLVWGRVADGLGIRATGVVPTLALLVAVPSVLALVNLTAFLPARAAALIRPAVALRSE
jgi:hypothetical protein